MEEKPRIKREYEERKRDTDNRYGINRQFTKEEFARTINAYKEKSSPGPDGIEYKMIKELTPRFKTELLERLNYAFI